MIRTLLAAWILLLHWTYSADWPRPYDDWKNTVFYLGAGVFGLVFVLKQRGSFLEKLAKPLLWIGLYLAVCLVLIQVPAYEGYLAWARLLLWAGLIGLLMQTEKDDLLFLGNLSLLSASLIAALAWSVYWMQYHELSFFHFTTAYTANVIPPIGHISYFGDFAGLHIPLAVWFLVRGGTRWQKKLGALSFILLLGGAWISGTRATLFAIFISVLFALLLFLKAKILNLRQAALLFVAFLCLLAGLALFQPSGFRTQPVLTRVTETFQAGRPEKQATVLGVKAPAELITGTRTLALYQSFKMFLERPLRGWGVGSFRFVYPPFSQFPRPNEDFSERSWFYHPHNEFAHQVVEGGLLGLGLFLALFVLLFVKGITALQKNSVEEIVPVVIALSGLVFLIVSWQFSTTFLNPLIRLMTAFYVALILKYPLPLACPEPCRRAGEGKGEGGLFSVRWIVIPLVLLFLGSTTLLGSYQLSLYYMLHGKRSIEPADKEKYLSRAVHLAPGAFDPLLACVAWRGGYEGYPKVEREVERLLKNYPHVPLVLYHAALLRIEQERNEEAIRLLEQALQIAPAFKEGKRVLEILSPS